MRFLPVDVKRIPPNAADIVYNAFQANRDFLPYYDLEISDEAFFSMEITLSPQFSDGNRIMLDTLCEKYNPTMLISESKLKDIVRL